MSFPDIYYSLLDHSQYGPIIRSYLVDYDKFQEASISLRRAMEASREAQKGIPREAFLIGEWGLTGVCMAYSLECCSWVEKHAKSSTLPPLMAGRPSESIRHLEKLLVLAVYQSIGKEVDPKDLTRTEANRDAINRVAKNYEALQHARTGIKMVRHFPGPTFF